MKHTKALIWMIILILIFNMCLPAFSEGTTVILNEENKYILGKISINALADHGRQKEYDAVCQYYPDKTYRILILPQDIAAITGTELVQDENKYIFRRDNYEAVVDISNEEASVRLNLTDGIVPLYGTTFSVDEMGSYTTPQGKERMYLPLEKMLYLLNTSFLCEGMTVHAAAPEETLWNILAEIGELRNALPTYGNVVGETAGEIAYNSFMFSILSLGDEISLKLFSDKAFMEGKMDSALNEMSSPAISMLGDKAVEGFMDAIDTYLPSMQNIYDYAVNMVKVADSIGTDLPADILSKALDAMKNAEKSHAQDILKGMKESDLELVFHDIDVKNIQSAASTAEDCWNHIQKSVTGTMAKLFDGYVFHGTKSDIMSAINIVGFSMNQLTAALEASRSLQWSEDFVKQLNFLSELEYKVIARDNDSKEALRMVSSVSGDMAREYGNSLINYTKASIKAALQTLGDDLIGLVFEPIAITQLVYNTCVTGMKLAMSEIRDAMASGDRAMHAKQQLTIMTFVIDAYNRLVHNLVLGEVTMSQLEETSLAAQTFLNAASHCWANLCLIERAMTHSGEMEEANCQYLETFLFRLSETKNNDGTLVLDTLFKNLYSLENGCCREQIPEDYVKPLPGPIEVFGRVDHQVYESAMVINKKFQACKTTVNLARPEIVIPDHPETAKKINESEEIQNWIKVSEQIIQEDQNEMKGSPDARYPDYDFTHIFGLDRVFSSPGAVTYQLSRKSFVWNVYLGEDPVCMSFSLSTGEPLTIMDILDKNNPDAEKDFAEILRQELNNTLPEEEKGYLPGGVDGFVSDYMSGKYGDQWYPHPLGLSIFVPWTRLYPDDPVSQTAVGGFGNLETRIPAGQLENVVLPEYLCELGANQETEPQFISAKDAEDGWDENTHSALLFSDEVEYISLYGDKSGVLYYASQGGNPFPLPDYFSRFQVNLRGIPRFTIWESGEEYDFKALRYH